MSNTRARLLAALGAVGLSVRVAIEQSAQATPATYGSFRELPAYMAAVWSDYLRAKVDFVQSYPTSETAARMAADIAKTRRRMQAEARAAAIRSLGGIPVEAARGVTGSPGLGEILGSITTGATSAVVDGRSTSMY